MRASWGWSLRGVALLVTLVACGRSSLEVWPEGDASLATRGDAVPETSSSGNGDGNDDVATHEASDAVADVATYDATMPETGVDAGVYDATVPDTTVDVGAYDATLAEAQDDAPDAAAEGAPEDSAPDATGTTGSDASADDSAPSDTPDADADADAYADDANQPDAAPDGGLGVAPDGAVLCRLNSDCAYLPSTFCQKDSCDPAVVGTCTLIPGTRETGYCSKPDGGGIVCGCDGNVYDYACIAHAQLINVASQGACPLLQDGGPCATNADCASTAFCKKNACNADAGICVGRPSFWACFYELQAAEAGAYACGCDHGTYTVDCQAQNYGINIDHEGPCPPPPSGPCTSQDDCGGSSYAGLIFCRPTVCGQPAGVCTGVQGACSVSSHGDDVCGCDGRSYINSCMSTWQQVGIAYGGGCRGDAGIVACDGGDDACAPGQACVLDPRTGCTGPSCPGVCVSQAYGSFGQNFKDDGSYVYGCVNTYTTKVPTLVSQSACDGGPCASCGYTVGSCSPAARTCPGTSYCWVTGCGGGACDGGVCGQTIPGCAMCAYTSPSTCNASTPCPAGQLCFPSQSCDGGTCDGVCVMP